MPLVLILIQGPGLPVEMMSNGVRRGQVLGEGEDSLVTKPELFVYMLATHVGVLSPLADCRKWVGTGLWTIDDTNIGVPELLSIEFDFIAIKTPPN